MQPPRSILIVRLSAIGDVLHTLPVLEALRAAFPQARIGWIVEELSAPLLDGHPALDKLYVIPKKRWRGNFWRMVGPEIRPFFRQAKADGWDVAIDVHGLTKSGLVAWASGAPLRIGHAGEDGREINKLFTNCRVPPPEGEMPHVVERNLGLLRALGIQDPYAARGSLHMRPEEVDGARARLREAGWDGEKGLVALNPGAGWETKRWSPGRFAEVGAALAADPGLAPLVVWGPGEEPARDTIAAGLRERGVQPVVSPRTTLRQLAATLSLCKLFIGGDTGPTHMAALLGKPVVGIFGASDSLRNRPWPRDSGPVLQRRDLPCCPCWNTVCPLAGDERLKCLSGIEASAVVEAARKALRSRAPQEGGAGSPGGTWSS